MKRLFRIFELSKDEQRIVLIVMFILITIAFVGYERRVRNLSIQSISSTEAKPSPTVRQIEEDR
jgi:predicted RND superfamily exporter protein